MKKAAMLAILGAVAAGAAAVCAKVIRDRQNEAEDEYTECPCGCSEEGDGQEQNSQPETAEQPVSEEFYQEEEPAETPVEEEAEEPAAESVEEPAEESADEPVEEAAQEPQETDSEETI